MRKGSGPRGTGARATLWVPAEMAALPQIASFVHGWLDGQPDFLEDPDLCYRVELAVVEATTNIIRHAYGPGDAGRIGLRLERAGSRLLILVLDEGVPFDPTAVPPPDLEEPAEGGYGVYLFREVSREVRYVRRGGRWNCLRMILSPRAEEAEAGEGGGRAHVGGQGSGADPEAVKAGGFGVTLDDVLAQEDVVGFLETLAALARSPLVVCRADGTPVAAFSGGGHRCPARVLLEDGSRGGARCPCEERGFRFEERLGVHEIRLQDWRLGEMRGCLVPGVDPTQVQRSLELGARWISDKINAEYNINSLSGEILNKYEELNLLYDLSAEISSVFDTREICEIVLRKALNVIGAEKASILLWDPSLGRLRVMASVGLPDEVTREVRLEPGDGICGYVFSSGKPLLVENLEDLPAEVSAGEGAYRTESFLSVPLLMSPLKVKERVIGIINLADNPSRRVYDAGDLKLLSTISTEAALSIYTSELIREIKENERIQREMEIAETVQQNLLPRHAPVVPGLDLAGRCVPARQVGGDYFDFFSSLDGGVGVVVADVSGHSIGSGIMMAITRGLLRSEAVRSRSPRELLSDVNRILYNDLVSAELFITMAYVCYRQEDRRLAFANGGHNPPILFRVGAGEPELLDAEGMAVGILPDVDFEERSWQLGPGDLLVLYTDGLVEAEDRGGVPFGMDRLIGRLRQARERTVERILEEVFQDVWRHIGGQDPRNAQQDDITLVVLRVDPRENH